MLGFSSGGLPQFSGIKKNQFWHKNNHFKFPRYVGSCYCKVVSLACSVPCLSACRNYTGSCLVAPFLEIPFFQYYVFFNIILLYVHYIGERFFPQNVLSSSFIKTEIIPRLESVLNQTKQTIESFSVVPIHFNHIVCCLCLSLQIESH